MTEFRRALVPQHAIWHTLVLTVMIIAGVALSLVAMHSVSLDHGASAATGSMASAATHHDEASVLVSAASLPAAECGDSCMPEHSMVAMGCILALVGSLLVAARVPSTSSWQSVRRTLQPFSARLSFLPLPEPPSLHFLSISRT
ncbi:hypothetical protein A20C1_08778 [marine actinobacterium PHSC20C1]|nr:hypothetical protein A20C1_08778 [marine actinobacterium PHSC20C1]